MCNHVRSLADSGTVAVNNATKVSISFARFAFSFCRRVYNEVKVLSIIVWLLSYIYCLCIKLFQTLQSENQEKKSVYIKLSLKPLSLCVTLLTFFIIISFYDL